MMAHRCRTVSYMAVVLMLSVLSVENTKTNKEVTVKILHNGQDHLIVEINTQVDLTCEVKNLKPSQDVRWLYLVPNGDSFRILTVGDVKVTKGDYSVKKKKNSYFILTISSITKDMNGTYCCDVIQDNRPLMDARIIIGVKEPHASMPAKKVGQLGQLTEFVCTYDGMKPWLFIKWTRKTTKFITAETKTPGMSMRMVNTYSFWRDIITVFHNGSSEKHASDTSLAQRIDHAIRQHPDGSTTFHLILKDLACADNGTFRCNVNHTSGISAANSRLILAAAAMKPVILGIRQSQVSEGQVIVLTCQGNVGIPAGALTWYHQHIGRPMQKLPARDSSTSIAGPDECTYASSASIVVSVSRDKHHAVYTCFAGRIGILPTLSSALVRYTLIVGGHELIPNISISPNHVVQRGIEVTIRCSIASDSPNALVALYSLQKKDKKTTFNEQVGDLGNIIAYMDERGNAVLVDETKYQGRLKVRGTGKEFELVINRVGCLDACVYRCGATRFSRSITLSVVDFTNEVAITSTQCNDVIDDDVDCGKCPYLARTHKEFSVICGGHVAFPDSASRSRFLWSFKTPPKNGFDVVPNTTSILGSRPISDVTHTPSGCFSEYKTSLLLYRPAPKDGATINISCELCFYSEGLQYKQRAEISVCVREGFAFGDATSQILPLRLVFMSVCMALFHVVWT